MWAPLRMRGWVAGTGYRLSTNGCGTPMRPSAHVKYVTLPLEALSV